MRDEHPPSGSQTDPPSEAAMRAEAADEGGRHKKSKWELLRNVFRATTRADDAEKQKKLQIDPYVCVEVKGEQRRKSFSPFAVFSGRVMLNTPDERRHETLPCEDGGVHPVWGPKTNWAGTLKVDGLQGPTLHIEARRRFCGDSTSMQTVYAIPVGRSLLTTTPWRVALRSRTPTSGSTSW